MEITNSMMKAQLKDYSDIVVPIDQNYDWLAPPTVRLMHWKEYATADALSERIENSISKFFEK